MSHTHYSLRHSLTYGMFALFVDQFGRSFRFYHLEFDTEAISNGWSSENSGNGRWFWILSNFRELSFCGPCGPCFYLYFFESHLLRLYWDCLQFLGKLCIYPWTVLAFFHKRICKWNCNQWINKRTDRLYL